MAQLTPKDILEISEPVEAIYQRTVDELLINIAKHFKVKGWERTRYWEIKKLSELGALTEESVKIIAKNTGMLPAEIEKAFLQVSEKACLDIDPQLKQAAKEGILQDPGTNPVTSPLMRQMIQAYTDQAVDKMNMTNTTMLESTRQAYLKAVGTVNEIMLQEAARILEAQALEVATGQETRTKAIRKAMDQMSRTGLTGFYDKRGRSWSPEAYSSMVIRTTSHNAAIESIKTRQREYGGGDIFQVSSHPGARPLCYPYQGKFFSWSEGPGEFIDGAGHTQRYDNINDSSYGEPAGLFGINCGHHPIPMIPEFSYPQDGPVQNEEENKKAYEESQVQRQYERNIREAKRDLEIAKATGDEELVKDAQRKVRNEQSKMRAFIDETGRARRYDREQISTAGIPVSGGSSQFPRPANEQPVLKQFDRYTLGTKTEAEKVAQVNPNYGTADKWDKNCQRCVVADEMIERGYNVTAKPYDPNDLIGADGWAAWDIRSEDILSDLGYVPVLYKDSYKDVAKEAFEKWGDGSRAIVRTALKNGDGHLFTAKRKGDKINYKDSLINAVSISIDDVLDQTTDEPGNIWLMRVDNRAFSDRVTDAVENVRSQ